jgi:hypothetical protein
VEAGGGGGPGPPSEGVTWSANSSPSRGLDAGRLVERTAEGACPAEETGGTPQPGGSRVRSATACTGQATCAAAGGDYCCRPN